MNISLFMNNDIKDMKDIQIIQYYKELPSYTNVIDRLNDEYDKLDNDNLKQKQKYGNLKKKYKNLKKKKKFSIKDIETSPNVLVCLICFVVTELSVILIFLR